jgi:hypothetical protein
MERHRVGSGNWEPLNVEGLSYLYICRASALTQGKGHGVVL